MFLFAFVIAGVAGYFVKQDYEALKSKGITVGSFSGRGWFWGTFWLLIVFVPMYVVMRNKAMAIAQPGPRPPLFVEPPAPPTYTPPVAPPVSFSQPEGYCPNCGRPHADQARFCAGCGSKFQQQGVAS